MAKSGFPSDAKASDGYQNVQMPPTHSKIKYMPLNAPRVVMLRLFESLRHG